MQKFSDHTQLDRFIVEVLKREDIDVPFVDWREVEVLLPHKQPRVLGTIGINKRITMIAVASLMFAVIAFGIFKIAKHYSSYPAETNNPVDSAKNTLGITNTSNEEDSVFVIPNITYADSLGSDKTEQEPDSASAVIHDDTAFVKKPNNKPTAVNIKPVQQQSSKQKQDKVQKLYSADTSSSKIQNIKPSPSGARSLESLILNPDTVVSKPVPMNTEIKTKTDAAKDTMNKNTSTQQKKTKIKKSKLQQGDTASRVLRTASPLPDANQDTSKKQ